MDMLFAVVTSPICFANGPKNKVSFFILLIDFIFPRGELIGHPLIHYHSVPFRTVFNQVFNQATLEQIIPALGWFLRLEIESEVSPGFSIL
jgi:hypothetical protein